MKKSKEGKPLSEDLLMPSNYEKCRKALASLTAAQTDAVESLYLALVQSSLRLMKLVDIDGVRAIANDPKSSPIPRTIAKFELAARNAIYEL